MLAIRLGVVLELVALVPSGASRARVRIRGSCGVDHPRNYLANAESFLVAWDPDRELEASDLEGLAAGKRLMMLLVAVHAFTRRDLPGILLDDTDIARRRIRTAKRTVVLDSLSAQVLAHG